VGEGCHFIDLIRHLAGSRVGAIDVCTMDAPTRDTVSIQMSFEDGSIGTVHYFANGPKAFPKERLEVFASGRVLQLDNFRKLRGFAWPGFRKMNLWSQDKGQKACAKAFVDAVAGRSGAPIPLEQVLEVADLSIQAAELGRTGT
jgi:predicted dehydrogenase